MILQSALRFLMDALTFMILLLILMRVLAFITMQKTPLPFIYLYRYVIRPFVKSYGDISNFTRSPGKILM